MFAADVLREDRSAVTALGKNDTTRKSRYAGADNSDSSGISPWCKRDRKKTRSGDLQIAV